MLAHDSVMLSHDVIHEIRQRNLSDSSHNAIEIGCSIDGDGRGGNWRTYVDRKIVDSIYVDRIYTRYERSISRYGGCRLTGYDEPKSILSGRNRRAGNEFAGSSGLSVRNYHADTANGVIQLLSDADPEAVVGL